MKAVIICLLALTSSLFCYAQISNPGFETNRDTLPAFPKSWNIPQTNSFSYKTDQATSASGKSSLQIKSNSNIGKTVSSSFTQTIAVPADRLKRISITAYIKTRDVKGNVGLWCRVIGEDDKMIGYQTLETQDISINGTNDWKKYQLIISLNTNARKLTIAGNLRGEGLAWFDDFAIDDYTSTDKAPTTVVNDYIKDVKNIVKQNSIYAGKLNWTAIDGDLEQLSKGLTTVGEAQILSNYVIDQLRAVGDKHSFIQSKAFAETYAKENVVAELPSAKMLAHNIAYVYIPAFGSTSDTVMQNFAQKIQQAIRSLDTGNKVKGWIVDLRKNGGGNMHPMIAGLGPLLGNGILGYFTSPKLRGDGSAWFYKNGTEGIGSSTKVKVKDPYTLINPDIKIAVLVGPQTASSGEMTTICFIGKTNTKLIGQPTGGYTTSNIGFKLKNGAFLYLASTHSADRNKKRYDAQIDPDIWVDGKNDTVPDAVINAAEKWLLN